MSETQPPEQAEQRRGFFARFEQLSIFEKVAYILGGVAAVFFIAIIAALVIGIGFGESEDVADIVAIIRDLFIILLAMQALLMSIAFIVLILQLATLINLLQNEISPIVHNLKDASNTVKGTTEFLSENVAVPVIESKAWMSGITTFMREIWGIRNATHSTASSTSDQASNVKDTSEADSESEREKKTDDKGQDTNK